MTILSVDPGSRSLGYAVWKDGTLATAGYLEIPERRPSAVLARIVDACTTMHENEHFDALAVERMFVNVQFGGNSARLLNVIPDELEAWAAERGIAFGKLANGTIKLQVTGNGHASKDLVYSYVQHLWEPLKDMPKGHRMDVSDAIAIGVAAMKKNLFPEPPTT